MKRTWLYILLGASLGLNLGTIGAIAYRRYTRWRYKREFTRHIDYRVRHEVSDLMQEHRAEMDSLRLEFHNARYELLELGLKDSVETGEVEFQLDRIASTYREMTRLVHETGLKIQQMQPKDRRKWLRRRMREMMRDPSRDRSRGRRVRGSRKYRGPRSHRDSYGPPMYDEPQEELPPPAESGQGD
jgi:hypothetical protein